MSELDALLKKIDEKLSKIETNLDGVCGIFTTLERENMTLRKEIEELSKKVNGGSKWDTQDA